jgi:hypothetical protein
MSVTMEFLLWTVGIKLCFRVCLVLSGGSWQFRVLGLGYYEAYKFNVYIHSYDTSKASSKASCPHSAILSFLLQMTVSSPFLKVIQ